MECTVPKGQSWAVFTIAEGRRAPAAVVIGRRNEAPRCRGPDGSRSRRARDPPSERAHFGRNARGPPLSARTLLGALLDSSRARGSPQSKLGRYQASFARRTDESTWIAQQAVDPLEADRLHQRGARDTVPARRSRWRRRRRRTVPGSRLLMRMRPETLVWGRRAQNHELRSAFEDGLDDPVGPASVVLESSWGTQATHHGKVQVALLHGLLGGRGRFFTTAQRRRVCHSGQPSARGVWRSLPVTRSGNGRLPSFEAHTKGMPSARIKMQPDTRGRGPRFREVGPHGRGWASRRSGREQSVLPLRGSPRRGRPLGPS